MFILEDSNMDKFYKLFFWRKNRYRYPNHRSDSDDDETNKTYIDQKDLKNELIEKFGCDDIHIKNLKNIEVTSSLNTLGSGAFSVVKKGFSEKYNSEVAIKIIRVDDETNKSYIQKYMPIELELWRELSTDKHANVLNLMETVKVESFVYIITEVADRGDLFECLLCGTMSEFKAKSVFKDIVSAVAYCHDKGIAHRDIKPQNLLLCKDDKIKLADFSFVTRCNPVSSQRCGTPGMLAPEQVGQEYYDPFMSDIWQLGITLYIMLFRDSPYKKCRKTELYLEIESLKHLYKGVPFPRNKMLSKECKDLISGMLQIETENRLNISQIQNSEWLNGKLHQVTRNEFDD